ncbi:MAG TPA: OsmC family protein [Bacteroidia bacterium]|nr:OsmC family protein [Bacteroidia bacterium]
MKVTLHRLNNAFHFEAKNEDGVTMQLDSTADHGGQNLGVRPMQSLLMAMGGCSAIDIISILNKQKQEISGFDIDVDGEREKGKEPALWKTVHAIFRLNGNIDPEKAKRAVQLSMEKYCSVAKTLEAAGAVITYDVILNGQNL